MKVAFLMLFNVPCGAHPISFQDALGETWRERRNMRRVPESNPRRLHSSEPSGVDAAIQVGWNERASASASTQSAAMMVALRTAVVSGGKQLLENAAGLRMASEQKGFFPSWVWGVLLTLFGSTLTSIGLVLQKYSHVRSMHKESATPNPRYYLQVWWVIGFTVWISAQVVNLGAMGLAPQTVLSCFGSWTIICNVVIARCVLKERVAYLEILAMAGLLLGAALVITGAPHQMAPHVSGDVHTIWSMLVSRYSVALMLSLGVAVLALKAVLRGAVYWIICAAILTGFTTLLAKCVSLMLVASPSGALSPWVSPQAYVILLSAALCGVLEVHTLNLGLKLGKAVLLTPIYLTTGMLAQILTSGVLLKEFAQFASTQQAVIFCLGVSISIGFNAMLMSARANADESRSLLGRDKT